MYEKLSLYINGQFISGDAGARYYLARPILGTSWRAALTYRF
jgi:hypothetical protein